MIVTGATGSMGAVAVRSFAAEGCKVVAACRRVDAGEALASSVRAEFPSAEVEVLALDLCSRVSIDSFVSSLGGRRICALFNNAGILSRDFVIAESGVERGITVNFLHTAYLTESLLPLFEMEARVDFMVSLSSKFVSYRPDWKSITSKDFGQLSTYALSKLLLLYYAIGFARRHPELHVNVSDPGVVNSKMLHMDRWFDPLADILFRPFTSSPAKGVAPALRALHSDCSLRYFVGRGDRPIPSKYLDSPIVDEIAQVVGSGV